MSRTYQANGIVLQRMPLGENDLLVTILTPECGLVRAVAPGARKYKSRLRGRSELFVVNQFLLVKGRSLDRIIQAETQESYPKLSRDLAKLTVSQYLAELVLVLGLSEQPQVELYSLLNEHLGRIEKLPPEENLFSHLAQAVFHLLAIAGIAPEFNICISSQKAIMPDFSNPCWRVGFSFVGGGLVSLEISDSSSNQINRKITALELKFFQSLANKNLQESQQNIPQKFNDILLNNAWIKVERILKDYLEFQLGRPLKSAEMINDILISF